MMKHKLILAGVLVCSLLYGVTELSYSAYRYFFTDTSPKSFWLFEHPGETVRFDPVSGYLLTRTPSRVARITRGQVEFAGSLRGNAQGFPDRDDFSVQRLTAIERRIAVFGDAFTAAGMEPLNSPNWPDRVEDLCGDGSSRPLVLLNFSQDDGGLANWASILRNVVVKDRYELDGLIFAVAWDDLDRKFAMFEQIDSQMFAYAQAPTWDVGSQPRTRSEARALLKKQGNPNTYVLSPAEFDAALLGHWSPRQWSFRISARLWHLISDRITRTEKPVVGFEPGQITLIKDIRQLANELSVPVAVVYIPFREELLHPGSQTNVERTREFSEILGATFFDGREAFHGLSSQQIKDDWFPFDPRWNRAGSDQFANFMAAQLQQWVAASAWNGKPGTTASGTR